MLKLFWRLVRLILKLVLNVLTLLRLKKRGWKWLMMGVFMMFVLPMIMKNCL